MNAKAALCAYLLTGDPISLADCFIKIGYSNISRELPRMIERPFGVMVSRTQMTGKNRFGSSINWYSYRLNLSLDCNQDGIKKMQEYVSKHFLKPQK